MTSKVSQDLPILTVSQLTNAIKHQLESTFPSIWLQGEVSNFKKHSSGHLYFSLKDGQAQISAVMFRGHVQSLKMIPKDGDQVVVYGGINVFAPSGKYQINVQTLRLAGVGELLLKLEELKKELHQRGWFSQEHKKPLPKFPKKIGIVTSPTGAAIRDMLNVLNRRHGGYHILLNPVKVQGEGAASEIARAIEQFNEHKMVDVIIVGRGGGSIEDLWAFNEEIVAKAIFESSIPIIGAVGHETDHCIAEYVADVRAPTPSAAAEIVGGEKAQQIEFLIQAQKQLTQNLRRQLRQWSTRLQQILKTPLMSSPYALIGPWLQSMDDARLNADRAIKHVIRNQKVVLKSRFQMLQSLKPTAKILHFRQRLESLTKQCDLNISGLLKQREERLKRVASALQSIDPKNLLKKGYSILFSKKTGSVITTIKAVNKGDTVKVLLSDGEALAHISHSISSNQSKRL
ncbi:Exodeoxyribonuclease 7 large subunit [Waddlia chondrophila 2032/99]|uniref:Exodeoxyribonuclease 7 large subunit n=1 Tax=Waddlia chondrophila 2032/99 TaxID=765953 RepID=F8LD09_9BACT|nr:Exodeoxyribonuclease 7 large subunit [Waddlia chondrophila 2032/99]